ncbi:MAG: hypothetical protein IKK33_03130 [Lachnospiraceae bacterium]|nr:hypothetical protein [Lachnospiraceae bacterium]
MIRERVKALIELSNSVEQADEIIVREGFIAVKEKIAFLKGMFDFTLIGRHREDTLSEEERDKMDYYSILSAIINAKWEA